MNGGLSVSLRATSDFSEALALRDIAQLRTLLIRALEEDRDNGSHSAEGYRATIDELVPEVWEPHDGVPFAPKGQRDPQYVRAMTTRLRLNFSREVYGHLMETGRGDDVDRREAFSRDRRGVRPWVSVVIVGGLCLLGAILIWGPSELRFLFSNWG